jgi:hypothetical protein
MKGLNVETDLSIITNREKTGELGSHIRALIVGIKNQQLNSGPIIVALLYKRKGEFYMWLMN